MIKYGIKIWSSNSPKMFQELLDLYKEKKIDFAELYTVPGTDFKSLPLKDIPITIHSFHIKHGFDILVLKDKKPFEEVVKAADLFNSRFIIVHAGGEYGSEHITVDFSRFKENIEKIRDKRIIIENMPALSVQGGNCFGYSLDELLFIKSLGFDFCLDIAHAYKSALWQKIDYKKFIEELIARLDPCYFHLSSGTKEIFFDQHLDIFEGDMDIKWIKNLLSRTDKEVCLVFETPKTGESLDNDMKNIDYFKRI